MTVTLTFIPEISLHFPGRGHGSFLFIMLQGFLFPSVEPAFILSSSGSSEQPQSRSEFVENIKAGAGGRKTVGMEPPGRDLLPSAGFRGFRCRRAALPPKSTGTIFQQISSTLLMERSSFCTAKKEKKILPIKPQHHALLTVRTFILCVSKEFS